MFRSMPIQNSVAMKRDFNFILIAFAALCISSCLAQSWNYTDLCDNGQSLRCPTIMTGISCLNASYCVVVGGYSNTPMAVYTSTNQFSTTRLAHMSHAPLLILDVALGVDGASGVTAGVGFGLGYSAISHAIGGRLDQWDTSSDQKMMQGQDVVALRQPGSFAFVGVTDNLAGQQGFVISTDSGETWQPRLWPLELANATIARYGAFVSDQIVYLTGGTWIHHTADRAESRACFPFSPNRCIAHSNKVDFIPGLKRYTAYITKSVDGGSTWTTQVKVLDQFSFNGIACASATQCVAVGEADDSCPQPGARIWATQDGQMWKQVWYDQSVAALSKVEFRTADEAWALGGAASGSTAIGVVLRSLNGGMTWQKLMSVPNIYVFMSFQFVTPSLVMAVAATENDSSTVVQFTLQ